MSVERNGDLYLNADESREFFRNISNPDRDSIKAGRLFLEQWGGNDEDYHEDGSISFEIPDLEIDKDSFISCEEPYAVHVKCIRIEIPVDQWNTSCKDSDSISKYSCSRMSGGLEIYEMEENLINCA